MYEDKLKIKIDKLFQVVIQCNNATKTKTEKQ